MKAWVLSGGGAKGAFQAGVLKRLVEQYGRPDVIYGTSVGSINGGAIAYKEPDAIIEEWMSIEDRSDILSLNWKFFMGLADGVYDMAPLRKDFLNQVIDGTPLCEVYACRVSVINGEIDFVSNMMGIEEFRDAVQDSSTIPIAMQPRSVWVDGGIREIVPLEKAIDDGATDIKLVLCNPWSTNPHDLWDFRNTSKFMRFIKLAVRVTDGIMAHEILKNDITAILHKMSGVNIDVYSPPKFLYEALDFDHEKICNAIELGLNAQPESLQMILGRSVWEQSAV